MNTLNRKEKKSSISIKKIIVYIVYMIVALLFLALPKTYIKVSISNIEDTQLLDAVFNSNREQYIYFGKSSCPQCYRFKKYINTFDRYLPNTIYYVDTDYWKDYDSEKLKELCEKYDVETVPKVIIVESGEYLGQLDIKQMFEDNGIVY